MNTHTVQGVAIKNIDRANEKVINDLGIIGTAINEENTHKSAGIGLEFIGIRLMAAKRLDNDENSWSVLFDLGGFFNRWEYLP